MSKKMLIDATHSEETRVAVLDGRRLEDFDFESKVKTSFKSNIYLAKVTRVEPSLQAAFVNFGGNRHGFLPFSEIHPDYFKIPIEDRERLMAEQEELARKIAERAEQRAQERLEKGEAGDEEDDIEAAIDDVLNEAGDVPEDDTDAIADDENDDVEASEPSEEQAEENSEEETAKGEEKKKPKKRTRKTAAKRSKKADEIQEDVSEEVAETDGAKDGSEDSEKTEADAETDGSVDVENEQESQEENSEENSEEGGEKKKNYRRRYRGRRGRRGRGGRRYSSSRSKKYDSVGGDEIEQDPAVMLWKKMRRSYKIQEVIKRNQIMLVQVQKEERGNKGAAVTTYITLPGRYGVLMPNSPRGGGISRKINWGDRKSLKEILAEVTIPKGMSVILRTAAVGRSKADIKRDLDYLYRLWDNIRELTLQSNAPALVYTEADLVQRAIRDIYTRDVSEIYVQGDEAYKKAKDFMKMMIPSHARKVKKYTESIPLFQKYQAESQIDEIYDIQVGLKSGGYLVINPTEALVSIDVNSGKATKERHIEETALRTNLESAEEVARQLRLRDLGGLVVIDFIDMEDYRNNREVERRLSQALEKDRARVQVGRISNFGLLELSRQRLRPSLTETHFETCPNCEGAGYVRTKETAALRVLRLIEEEGMKGRTAELQVDVPSQIGLYIMNVKRDMLNEIESRYEFKVFVRLNPEYSVSDVEFDRIKTRKKKKFDNLIEEAVAEEDIEAEESSSEAEDIKVEAESKAEEKPKKTTRGRRGSRAKSSSKKETADKEESKSDEKSEDSSDPVEDKKAKPKKPSSRKKKTTEDKKSEAAPKEELKENIENLEPSNDDTPSDEPKDYETVNQAPKKKKKGWWNKLID